MNSYSYSHKPIKMGIKFKAFPNSRRTLSTEYSQEDKACVGNLRQYQNNI